MKAVGYVRTSTDKQEISPDMQRAKIEAYCQLHDLELIETIMETARSGKDLKRPGAQRLMTMVEDSEVNAVVVYKLDRLARSTRDTLDLVEKFNKANVSFHSVEERLDTKSAMGEFVITIVAALAQMERRMISDRTRDNMAYAKTQGKHMGRDGFQGAEAINEMRTLRSQGFTYDDIARDLNARQVPTDRGGRWMGNTVRRILNRAA